MPPLTEVIFPAAVTLNCCAAADPAKPREAPAIKIRAAILADAGHGRRGASGVKKSVIKRVLSSDGDSKGRAGRSKRWWCEDAASS